MLADWLRVGINSKLIPVVKEGSHDESYKKAVMKMQVTTCIEYN